MLNGIVIDVHGIRLGLLPLLVDDPESVFDVIPKGSTGVVEERFDIHLWMVLLKLIQAFHAILSHLLIANLFEDDSQLGLQFVMGGLGTDVIDRR